MIPSTQLWIGNHAALVQKVYAYVTDIVGVTYKDLIVARQFHAVRWFAPQKNHYTRADIDPLLHHCSFAAEPFSKNFVIIEQADLLSVVCANSLLKLLEEPPAGYHFILLAQRREALLSTIISRCVITEIADKGHDYAFLSFLSLLKNPTVGAQQRVMQELEKTGITEYQTRLALDELYRYWAEQYRSALLDGDVEQERRAERMMRIVVYLTETPPMPGSIKLFWRTAYLLLSL